jgi:alkanesulfonate monooxygenase SsuD/methylene tetrahydromethanopterin reductase-like flavin-dependent oxidoreductase (luciferase family)
VGILTFGLSLPNRAILFGSPFESLLETAEAADKGGVFDSVWVGDNLLSKPRLEAITTLSSIATRTKNVKLGTICFASFPMRHPITFAIQWASLDIISSGRSLLSVCIGGAASLGPQFAAELKNMGIRSVERVGRMEEGIELLRRFWSENSVTHQGKYYTFNEVNALPKPIQQPMPITIAVNPMRKDDGIVERALRRVARISDGWQSDVTPPEVFGSRWARIQEYAKEYGRADKVKSSMLHLMVNINDDAKLAREQAVEFFTNYYGSGVVTDEFIKHWLAYGPPEDVISKIEEFIDVGCTTPVLRFVNKDQMGQLNRCTEEVIPAFKNKMK